MWKCRVQISGGFLLLLGWFWLANGGELLLYVFSAAVLHELGHFLMLRAAGASVRQLQIGICGAVMVTDSEHLSYGWELASVLAGPGMNFLLAALLLTRDSDQWAAAAGAHLVLGCFNMLPLRPLDGGRALYLLASWWGGPGVGERVARTAGILCGSILVGVLLYLIVETGGSLWLFPAAAGVTVAVCRECCQKRDFL